MDSDAIAVLVFGSFQRHPVYASGNGTSTIIFEYKVVEGDSDDDGVDAFMPHGQDVKASGTNIAYVPNPGGTTPWMEDDPDHKVDATLLDYDTTAPTLTSLELVERRFDTYRENAPIEVEAKFDESVEVTGTPRVELDIGGETRYADYQSAEAEAVKTIKFTYTVQEGDVDSDGISIDEDKLELNGGTIKDEAGNSATLDHDEVSDSAKHKVDAPDVTPPTVKSLAITSDPGDDETYAIGDEIKVAVTFGEDVTVTGSPKLRLELALDNKQATYSSTDGDKVIFTYTVESGDRAPSGVSFRYNALFLSGGTIKDDAGNDATLTLPVGAALSGHKVDGVAPTVSLVDLISVTPHDLTYRPGDRIQVAINFSKPVTVTGTPQLTLNIGGTSRDAGYGSTDASVVTFAYDVVSEDSDTDGVSIDANSLALNDGTIKDRVGNSANLSHVAVADDPDHLVSGSPRDTDAPVVQSISITSDPGDDATYGAGDEIEVTVTFSEDVTVTGTPQIELDIGGSAKTASYDSTDGDDVTFTYTVAIGDSDDDGIAIEANKLSLNGGTIKDGGLNSADLRHGAVPANTQHLVDAPGGL